MPSPTSIPEPVVARTPNQIADDNAVAAKNAAADANNPGGATPNPAYAAAQSGSNNPLIVTSNTSRTQYAANTNALAAAKTAIIPATGTTPAAPSVTPTGGVTSSMTSVKTPAPAAPGAMPVGTTQQITDTNGGIYTVNAKGDIVSGPSSGQYQVGANVSQYPEIKLPTNTPGSTGASDSSGNTDGSSAGLDPIVQKQYTDSIDALNQGVTDAKSNLDAARATYANDPALQATIDGIKAQYDKQIAAMQAKNKLILGSYSLNGARTGSLQYANEMDTNFMSHEQGLADARVTDLMQKEQDLIIKATIASQTKDYKALNSAMTDYSKANADKLKAVSALATATYKAVQQQQAAVKTAQAAIKATNDRDIKTSTALGNTMANDIKSAGITDPAQIDQYIQGMADKYGITNPDVLKSAFVKAQQDQSKADLAAQNTASIIKKRNAPKVVTPKSTGGGTDGGYKYTGSDITTYTSFLNQGGKSTDGKTAFAPRGADGYVDPSAYTAAYNDWIKNNGTPQGFLKKFPISNINPTDYKKIPAALQPKAKAAAAAPL